MESIRQDARGELLDDDAVIEHLETAKLAGRRRRLSKRTARVGIDLVIHERVIGSGILALTPRERD